MLGLPTFDPMLVTFFCGASGSFAVEVVTMLNFMQRGEPLPDQYRKGLYYVLRLLIVLAAGGLAVAYGVSDKPLLAINIGASAPLILQKLASGLKN